VRILKIVHACICPREYNNVKKLRQRRQEEHRPVVKARGAPGTIQTPEANEISCYIQTYSSEHVIKYFCLTVHA